MEKRFSVTTIPKSISIQGYLGAGFVDCRIDAPGCDNADARFELSIETIDQIHKGCNLVIVGNYERENCIELFEEIVKAMKLLQTK